MQTLDEVDFTVLAATSVLGDLMHKCPPAEACRDAFERMSKATVQMALSTTGFGSQVDLTRHFRANAPQLAGGLYSGRPRYSQRQRMKHTMPPPRQTQTRQSRPMPRFDMNLEDLFGDDNDNISTGRTSSTTRKRMQTYPGRTEGYSELSSSPTVAPEQESRGRTSPMEYCGNYEGHPFSPQQQQQQQQQHYCSTNSPQQSLSPGSFTPSSTTNPPPFPATAGGQDEPSGMSLDFLDFDSTGSNGQLGLGFDGNSDYDYDVAMPSLGHSVGIDLGFGMAVDFQHDWSENVNYDMLEGYFFGGSGGGGGG